MQDTKLYFREVTKREAVNRFGKLGYNLYCQYVITKDITKYNKRKHIKFREISQEEFVIRYGFNPFKIYEKVIIDDLHDYFIRSLDRDTTLY